MKLRDDVQRSVLARLSRIEGQARGVQRMIEEGRDCQQVVRQLAAMRAALGKAAVAIIGENLEECLRQGGATADGPEVQMAKLALMELV